MILFNRKIIYAIFQIEVGADCVQEKNREIEFDFQHLRIIFLRKMYSFPIDDRINIKCKVPC